MGLPAHRRTGFTFGDYKTWPEDERWELIEGVAYCMTPAPSTDHQDVTGELFFQLRSALKATPCRPYVAPMDVLLPEGNEENDQVVSIVQPDVFVVCDSDKISRRGCRGAPDFVIEVLSPSTGTKDRLQKAALYAKHGVREYWLVDPVYADVTVYRLQDDGRFGFPAIVDGEGSLEIRALPSVSIDLDAVFEAARFAATKGKSATAPA